MLSKIISLYFKKFMAFSLVGAIVTPLSLGTNFFLLKYYKTNLYITYICVYAAAISLSFYLNSKFTFKTSIKFRNWLKYYGIYISGMVLGVILISLFKSFTNFENWVYPFLVIPFTMTWNFFTADKYLSKK